MYEVTLVMKLNLTKGQAKRMRGGDPENIVKTAKLQNTTVDIKIISIKE